MTTPAQHNDRSQRGLALVLWLCTSVAFLAALLMATIPDPAPASSTRWELMHHPTEQVWVLDREPDIVPRNFHAGYIYRFRVGEKIISRPVNECTVRELPGNK